MAPTANCPTCQGPLLLTPHDAFDSWVCPNGHGIGATLSELYEVAQEDEIHRLWDLARHGAAGTRRCPMCTRPMVAVSVPYDTDEAAEGEPGDTPDLGEVPVDVCAADQAIWFDTAELDQLPADLPDPQPTPEQEAALADAVRRLGEDFEAAVDSEAGFTDRLADRIRWSPTAAGLVFGRTRTTTGT